MSGLRSDHLLSARAGFVRANMPILSSVDVPFVAIMPHGHKPSRFGKNHAPFFPGPASDFTAASVENRGQDRTNLSILSMRAFPATGGGGDCVLLGVCGGQEAPKGALLRKIRTETVFPVEAVNSYIAGDKRDRRCSILSTCWWASSLP